MTCVKCAAWAQYQGDYDFKCNCKKDKKMSEIESLLRLKRLNQVKAHAIHEFVSTMIGAFESGFVDTNTLNLQQLHRIAQHHIKDNYSIDSENMADEWGQEFAEKCVLPKQ